MRIFLKRWALVGCVAGCSTVDPGGQGAETEPATAPETGGGTGGDAAAQSSGEAPTTAGESTVGPFMETDPSGPASATGTATFTSGAEELTGGTSGGGAGEGCGADAGPEGPQARTIAVAGAQRSYTVVIPPGYDPATPYPLVFAWHGRGGSGGLARLYFKIEEAAAGAAIFVYPDGLPLADMDDQTGWDLTEGGVDVQFFDAMLADVAATACVDPGRVFSAGHSFGGFMSNSLGCYRGGTVRAIAPVAGGGPFGACTGQVAAWLAHGTLDAVVPFASGEASRDAWVAANGCDAQQADPVDPAPCAAYAGCDAGFPVHWCAHDEAALSGHGWPAWAGPGIWAFFAGL